MRSTLSYHFSWAWTWIYLQIRFSYVEPNSALRGGEKQDRKNPEWLHKANGPTHPSWTVLWMRKKKKRSWDFPGSLVVKTLPSKARSVDLISDWGVKIPHALGPKNQNTKQHCNKCKKTLKIVHIKTSLFHKPLFSRASFLWLSWSRIHLQPRRPGFNPWVGKIP